MNPYAHGGSIPPAVCVRNALFRIARGCPSSVLAIVRHVVLSDAVLEHPGLVLVCVGIQELTTAVEVTPRGVSDVAHRTALR